MLGGTSRRADELVAVVPPTLVECTVEKVAINAVMAGCLPEYLPIVLAAVAGTCSEDFNAHGLLATTAFAGPMVIVNGPIAKAIGMNSRVNVFGQGNRANSTIGRALQLVIRNVGGGKPGEIDRATFGNPAKIGFCFAESEDDERAAGWQTLAEEVGVPAGVSAITLFPGEAPVRIADATSRTAPALLRTFAEALRGIGHPPRDAILAVSPGHLRSFVADGWDRARVRAELAALLEDGEPRISPEHPRPNVERRDGPGGDPDLVTYQGPGLVIVHCGGDAGMFSALITGWVGSPSITREVMPWA
jgi:hypothetical protein